MKTKALFIILLTMIVLSGCYRPGYLPRVDSMHESPYGSYMKMKSDTKGKATGELIAIDNNLMYILLFEDGEKRVETIAVDDIEKFTVIFAEAPSYGGFIPLSAVVTLVHGFFLVLSLPVNVIATGTIAAISHDQVSYSDDDITIEQLRQFARFPQGIPQGLDLNLLSSPF
jgi:hypothetical protein